MSLPVEKRISTLIVGCNALGREVAEVLISNGVELLVLDPEADAVEQFLQHGLPAEQADVLDDRILRQHVLGSEVRQLFCFFEDDADNVFLVLSARELASREKLQIIAVADSEGSMDKLLAAGADEVIDPYETTAHKIYSQITRPLLAELSDALLFANNGFQVAEVVLTGRSPFIGMQLSEVVDANQLDVIVLGMTDLELSREFHFRGKHRDHHLDAGDVLVVMGPQQAIQQFRHWLNPPEI